MAITVGDGACPLCDTVLRMPLKGGLQWAGGSVGACKTDNCRFNISLGCNAGSIRVILHQRHAECGTYKPRVNSFQPDYPQNHT